jgi:ankyrin repeat protein
MAIAGVGYRPGSIGMNRRDQGIGPDAARLLVAANEQPTWEGTKLILELGSDVNAANDSGDTALHGAAGHAYSTVVELLVGHGAKLDIKNKRGTTAQELLCRSSASDRC